MNEDSKNQDIELKEELFKKVKEVENQMSDNNVSNTVDMEFEYGKTYYYDKSRKLISKAEFESRQQQCHPIVPFCCRIQLPRGFNFGSAFPNVCFDLSDLSCCKEPIVQEVTIPTCEPADPLKCRAVAGYEIRAVGAVNFAASASLMPINGFPDQASACCSATVPTNAILSYTCTPDPCPKNIPCVDWTFAFFAVTMEQDKCGTYLVITGGVALYYTGVCG